jgi:ketosteroid isomerase-like protein
VSQENVEIVRRSWDAWGRGGVDAMLEFLDPQVEWRVRADLPDAGTYRGHEGIRQLIARFEEVLEDMGVEAQEYIDAGDRVVVPLHWWGRGRLSGVEVAERQGETWVLTVGDGRITKVEEYRHKQEALEAVGLPAES